MRKKNGFVISTTLYSIFGIMLLTVFYVLYALSNNRYVATSSINGIKDKINNFSSIEIEEPEELYKDGSGANEPILANGMIPVIYDETNDVWVKASLTEKWYDYNEQMWANAVTTTSENRETYLSDEHIGQEIPMDEINSMWVWIPRYRYKIETGIGSTTTLTNPAQIDVVFEPGTETNGATEPQYRTGITSSGTNTSYYTHPAFRNAANITYDSSTSSRGAWDEEITGFWVAKFEVGTSNATCNTTSNETNCRDVEPLIKPDIISLRSQSISTQFKHSLKFAGGTMNTSTGEVTFTANENNIYGLNTTTNTTDTHLMKNTEWGAVAILSQSQYGKMGNSNYTGANKEIYKNNSSSYITGRSLGTPPQSTVTNIANGTYSYNDKSCSTTTTATIGNVCTGTKNQNAGLGASTTGTIYGVYDMSGGAWEYTMGNYRNTSQSSGFSVFPSSKYYDYYTDTNITKANTILGDGIWETYNWYSDLGSFFNTSYNYVWSNRSAGRLDAAISGIFAIGTNTGGFNADIGWRSVLISGVN